MVLVGRYRSPFTRRVAISLRILDIAYEHLPYTAWSQLEAVRRVNPVGRVPALVLDSGESLFDSTAILDHLDQLCRSRSGQSFAAEHHGLSSPRGFREQSCN